ncbi:GIY-YIG nuclease family protein [Bradyrhizobium sp. IC3195]|uniref:hypothetical protein n=1 Tax=Bradyrhizobium sp. IC3195 TaxID=2793804 RepID=UPI001CD59D66|nr:hypothetical protein [Bradyrhizobium sp. IC3195]MCA1473352.1 GIY-YIG nuclease family protein [Bradyrhizobium sp. IC3195]
MSPFTAEERAFLDRHGFSESEVYDGRHQSKQSRERNARHAGNILILTDSYCKASGHRIRTRAGHCAQCKPANIGFTRRETQTGNVYIAGSLNKRFIKIGVAGDIWQREGQLRAERYGGAADWRVLIHDRVANMQQVERQISLRIAGDRVYRGYLKDGVEQVATEIIRCSFSAALDAYAKVTGLVEDRQYWLKQWSAYEF